MFNPNRKYKIHWELTNLCNLKCPMCPRTDAENHCQPVQGIRKAQYYLEDVKQYLPASFLRKLHRIDFCGNFGDPCIAKDFFEICEYLIKEHKIIITVSTNGSMRNSSWWKKLGELFANSECHIDFHIDGLEDTNHLYRIGASWDKIMRNTDAFISGGGSANWLFILFKHNQHQLDEAQKTARMMGFNSFVHVATGRFPEPGKFKYVHPDGYLCHLEEATITIDSGQPNSKTELIQDNNPPCKPVEKEAMESHSIADCRLLQDPVPSFLSTRNGIICKASKSNRFYLDANGYVTPCCWVSNGVNQSESNMFKAITTAETSPEKFNIKNRSIEKILRDEVFQSVFNNLWESNSLSTCRKKCGRKHRNIQSTVQFTK